MDERGVTIIRNGEEGHGVATQDGMHLAVRVRWGDTEVRGRLVNRMTGWSLEVDGEPPTPVELIFPPGPLPERPPLAPPVEEPAGAPAPQRIATARDLANLAHRQMNGLVVRRRIQATFTRLIEQVEALEWSVPATDEGGPRCPACGASRAEGHRVDEFPTEGRSRTDGSLLPSGTRRPYFRGNSASGSGGEPPGRPALAGRQLESGAPCGLDALLTELSTAGHPVRKS